MEKDAFKMPNAVTIKGRSSSITNSFFNGIIPVIYPTEEEIKTALRILEQNEDDVRCVYCGDKKTEWDHLHPLIVDKNHTGYITEIANLVPACGKCNQSKGNSDWKEWMIGDAKLSPKSRGIKDLSHRIEIIEKYDKTFPKKKIDLAQIIGKEKWTEYKSSLKKLEEDMENTQNIMNEIKSLCKKKYDFIQEKVKEHAEDYTNIPDISKSNITTSKVDNFSKKENINFDNNTNQIQSEIKKIINRLPRWFENPNQYNSKILFAFLRLYTPSQGYVLYEDLEQATNIGDVFSSNFVQMKNFGKKNHGKIFEQIGEKVYLWNKISDYVLNLYTKQY